ncbi:hypothetical protein DFJ73DRAFT_216898 [Zopfochytrium polystomum]|nr:hypothetical protein DFJ73DRAFT_216898 [Zopfochytrium polystomum]
MSGADPQTPTGLRKLFGTPEPSPSAKLVFDDYPTCDVVLLLLPTRRRVFANKKVLAAASCYFTAMFDSGFAESSQSHVKIEIRFSERAMMACLAFAHQLAAQGYAAWRANSVVGSCVGLDGEAFVMTDAIVEEFFGIVDGRISSVGQSDRPLPPSVRARLARSCRRVRVYPLDGAAAV